MENLLKEIEKKVEENYGDGIEILGIDCFFEEGQKKYIEVRLVKGLSQIAKENNKLPEFGNHERSLYVGVEARIELNGIIYSEDLDNYAKEDGVETKGANHD